MIPTVCCLGLLLGVAGQAPPKYLSIGDAAPTLSHVSWVKGTPIPAFEPGKLYVVEFWATWCGPCKANIPTLTALAHKYAGEISFAGIDIWEATDAHDLGYPSRVKAFVQKEGSQMDYHVAFDDPSKGTADAWMKAAGEGGIPMSFVIGRDGKIAWMGHAQGLEGVLAQVTAGTFDVQAARRQRAVEVEDVRPVREALDAKKYDLALDRIDAIVAKRPEMSRMYDYDRYVISAHTSLDKTKAMTAGIIKSSGGEIGAYQMMCSVYASEPGLSPEAYRFGLDLIREALTKNDRQYLFLSMAGAVSHSLHDRPGSIDYARQAVSAAETDEHAPKPFVEFLKRTLSEYQAGAS